MDIGIEEKNLFLDQETWIFGADKGQSIHHSAVYVISYCVI